MRKRMNLLDTRSKHQHIQKRRVYMVVVALAVMVTVGTIWALVQPASAMTGKVVCENEEHMHSDECYELIQICGQAEGEEHIHTDECWQQELVCTLSEHEHGAECYEDTDAEDAAVTDTEEQSKTDAEDSDSAAEESDIPEEGQSEESTPEDSDISVPEKPEETTEPQPDDKLPEVTPANKLPKEIPEDYTDVRSVELSEGGCVYVYARPDTIPENVKLKVKVLDETGKSYEKAVERLQFDNVSYDFVKALDISLRNSNDEEVEPEAPVYLVMDFGGLFPEEASMEDIRIQHHKEIVLPEDDDKQLYMEEENKVELESVVDDDRGLLEEGEDSCIATFPIDSFSIFTITSRGWETLNLNMQCVDEYSQELIENHRPDDIEFNEGYKPGAKFDILFMSGEHYEIPGYKYDNKAYLMDAKGYKLRIYGLHRENDMWYYYPNDKDKSKKTLFSEQPVFVGDNPKNYIRLVYKKTMDIPVMYMDDIGGYQKKEIPLSNSDAPKGKNPGEFQFTGTELDISNSDLMPKSNTYFFVGRAYVGEPKPKNEVLKVIRDQGELYGVTHSERRIHITKDTPLKLMYHKTSKTPGRIKTVSTADKGMVINLFDYNSGENCGPEEGINKGRRLKFVNNINSPDPYNRWTGADGGIYTGIVGKELVNGYPTIQGESLDYLFDPAKCREELTKPNGNIVHVHTKLDHLFWRDKDGYYRYDSMTNFATIMDKAPDGSGNHNPDHTDGGEFIVYQQPALPGTSGTGDNPKFLPFNTYAQANTPTATPAINDKNKQYHFGMTMEANFIMPPGGVIPDEDGEFTGMQDMIFEFNGDDDVWVFIDDKLALDLGGIHDRYGGTINFRTGEVTTNAPPMEHSGLRQDNLYGIDNPDDLTEEELAMAREKKGFGKFSQHNFKFFYLERGRGASNCEIKFNLVPVEHALIVGKRIPQELDGAATEHMWYQFQAEASHGTDRHFLANAAYTVVKWNPEKADPFTGGQMIGTGKTDDQGRFWLRAGERADFLGAVDLKHAGTAEHDKITIHVREIFPQDDPVKKVSAWSGKEEESGTFIEIPDETGNNTIKSIPALYDSEKYKYHIDRTSTTVDQVQNQGEIVYQADVKSGIDNMFNWVDFENDLGALSGLNINKIARHTDGSPLADVPFAIRVELWDTKDQKWVPLPDEAEYWILEEGQKPTAELKRQLDKSEKGLISIKDGQWIHLHLLPGTKYRVSEALSPEESVVYKTSYEGTVSRAGEDFEIITDEAGRQTGICNKSVINAGSQHNITITNEGDPVIIPKGSFVLKKETYGVIPSDIKFDFDLRVCDYATGDTDAYLPSFQCEATYYGTPEGKREGNPKNGITETLTFTPETTSGGTDGAPAMGENYRTSLHLYPNEFVVIKGLPNGKSMYVQEKFSEEQTGHYDVSFREEGESAVSGPLLDKTVGTISKDGVLRVVCTNTSKLQSTTILQISKTVKRTDQPGGEPIEADKKEEFPFKITLKNLTSFDSADILSVISKEDGTNTPIELHFKESGDEYAATVNLKHGETLIIQGLPIDIDVVVQETEHNGYAVSMNGTSGDTTTVHLKQNTGKVYEVQCVNLTGVELPETGGHGLMPIYLIGTILVCVSVWMLYRRRRGHEKV